MIKDKKVLSSFAVTSGGICEAISKMSFGNKIGFEFNEISDTELFEPKYGSIIVELSKDIDIEKELSNYNYKLLGTTNSKNSIKVKGSYLSIDYLYKKYCQPLESIFPTKVDELKEKIETISFITRNNNSSGLNLSSPKVFIPTFPGSNCEYDCARAFEKAGAKTSVQVFKNLNYKDIEDSIDTIVKEVNSSQIIMLPGGFSAGDEPDGSGKFIATIFRNPKVSESVMNFLKNKDGLILGICNGFQALIKLGLLPYGEIRDIDENSPTLTYNKIGRHQSKIVQTKISSNLSPWLKGTDVDDIHSIAISHGEGRFVCNEEVMDKLISKGQIATQYVDFDGYASYDIEFNPNGSFYAVEGISSPDGRILGKMGHSERIGQNIIKNIIGEKDQRIFESGVNYFKG